ncbi:MAG: acyltransferase, partial [Prevotellaceae bacterium]|nr:acyltransferase [Prevotellaceae bacterium]
MNVMQNEEEEVGFGLQKYPADDETLSKTVEWLRFPLATAVIFTGVYPGSDVFGVAAPCIFLLYGFSFFFGIDRWNGNTYANKIKSRFGALIVPYLLWNIIAVCADASLALLKPDESFALRFSELYNRGLWRIFWNVGEWNVGNTDSIGRIAQGCAPYLAPLCLLRDLIVMVILSPLIYRAVRFGGMCFAALAGALYYTKAGFGAEQFTTALFFFSLGAQFGISGKNPVVALRRGRFYWMLAAIVCLPLSTYLDGSKAKDYVFPLFALSGAITAINLTAFFIERGALKAVSTLSKASFFVYAAHGVLILSLTSRLFD